MKSIEDLDIFNMAFELALNCRSISLKLDNPDRYEVGSQLRRSSQSVKNNIVEGYGRRRYKGEYIKFLIYSYASLQESKYQLKFIQKIKPNIIDNSLLKRVDTLGIMIFRFIKFIEKNN